MACEHRGYAMLALSIGLLGAGGLSLAIVADYWLYTVEPWPMEWPISENTTEMATVMIEVFLHSGLWRACTFVPEAPSQCSSIGYFQTWEKVEGGDTTNSILRAIRKSSPFMVGSLFILIFALGLSTVGNTKRDTKTVWGAVFYICSALILGLGVIFYISAVNEVTHRRKPSNPEDPQFSYSYGWAFFFAGSSFISSMGASVVNISLYVKRYPNLEDMAAIVPGLDSKSYDFSSANSKLDEQYDMEPHNSNVVV